MRDLFSKDEDWVPYVGPKGGTGWVNEDGIIDYGDDPPGNLDLSQFSDEEIEQLREEFEEDGRDLDQYIDGGSGSGLDPEDLSLDDQYNPDWNQLPDSLDEFTDTKYDENVEYGRTNFRGDNSYDLIDAYTDVLNGLEERGVDSDDANMVVEINRHPEAEDFKISNPDGYFGETLLSVVGYDKEKDSLLLEDVDGEQIVYDGVGEGESVDIHEDTHGDGLYAYTDDYEDDDEIDLSDERAEEIKSNYSNEQVPDSFPEVPERKVGEDDALDFNEFTSTGKPVLDDLVEARDKSVEVLRESHPDEAVDTFEEQMSEWWDPTSSYTNVPELWAVASQMSGNGSVPYDEGSEEMERIESMDENVAGVYADMFRLSQDTIRENAENYDFYDEENDEVTLFRGFDPDILDQYGEETEEGATVVQPQSLESWSYEQHSATGYGDGFEKTFDLEDVAVFGDAMLSIRNDDYREITMMGSEPHILTDKQVDEWGQGFDMAKQDGIELETLPKESSDWLYSIDIDETKKSNGIMDIFQKAEWEPYIGPQGGKGWRNVETDEVVYDDSPPGGVSLPEEFGAELDPDFNLNTLSPDDQVLAITSDGKPVVVDADNPYISQDDVFGVVEEESDDLPSGGEWEERDPSELENIPEGTEVRLETLTQEVTGEFEGESDSEYVEEWYIDGKLFTPAELAESTTELYVNEESIPEDDVPDFVEDYEEFDSDQIGEVMEGTQTYVQLDSGDEIAGEFQGQSDVMSTFGNDYLIDGIAFDGDSVEDLYVGYAGGGNPDIPESWDNDVPGSTEEEDDSDSVDDINEDIDETLDGLLNQDPVLESEEPDPTTEGEQLVEDLVEKHDMPDEDWDFDPDEIYIDEFQQDILALSPGVLSVDFAEYEWDTVGDFLRDHPDSVMAGDLYDVMQVVSADEGGFDVGDEFSFSNAENVDVGQYVTVTLNEGKQISGKVVNHNEEQGYMEVENSNDTLMPVRYFTIAGGEVVDEEDVKTDVNDLPENPTVDDIQSKIYDKGIDPSSVTGSDKKDAASILIGAKDERGASNETVASVIADVAGSRNRHRIASYMMEEVTQYSETLDMEVPMNRDNNVKNELKKIGKTFQEENPEYEDRLEDIYDQFAEWTGGTVRQGTAAMWAAAIENGADNVPEEMAGWVDELQQEDPEFVDAMKEYSEMTSEVLEDIFGDSVMLYRGIDGDYGGRKMDEVDQEGDATVDHRGLASWTLNPDVTTSFERGRGVMTAQEVDVEDIFVGFPSSTGFDYEIELVASGGVEDYSEAQTPDEVGDGSIVTADTMVDKDKLELFMEQYDELSDT